MYTSTFGVCSMCVPTYSSRSGFEMLVFQGGGGGGGGAGGGEKNKKEKRREKHSFFKNITKYAERCELISRGLQD